MAIIAELLLKTARYGIALLVRHATAANMARQSLYHDVDAGTIVQIPAHTSGEEIDDE